MSVFLDWFNGDAAVYLHPVERAVMAYLNLMYIHPFVGEFFNLLSSFLFIWDSHWQIQETARDERPPLGPISFIFLQFFDENLAK